VLPAIIVQDGKVVPGLVDLDCVVLQSFVHVTRFSRR
jgi:hypothetical protein